MKPAFYIAMLVLSIILMLAMPPLVLLLIGAWYWGEWTGRLSDWLWAKRSARKRIAR